MSDSNNTEEIVDYFWKCVIEEVYPCNKTDS